MNLSAQEFHSRLQSQDGKISTYTRNRKAIKIDMQISYIMYCILWALQTTHKIDEFLYKQRNRIIKLWT